jgi:hypothetical protein
MSVYEEEHKPRHQSPQSTHTSVSISKSEMQIVRRATAEYNSLYGTSLTVKDFVREAIAQKVARLEDELVADLQEVV